MNWKEKSADISIVCDRINSTLNYDLNFFAYRIPGEKSAVFGASKNISSDLSSNGFIIAPFIEDENSSKFIIPFDYDTDIPLNVAKHKENYFLAEEEGTNHNEYISQANDIINYLKDNGGKIVLSRQIIVKQQINIGKTFKTLAEKYPNAFVFCFYSYLTGLWIGASPELLFSLKENEINIMSLAGTRPVGTCCSWDIKCIEEQQIVTDYIANILSNNGLHSYISQPYNRQAGPVEHICTDIRARLESHIDIWELIDNLSPTPALSGYPKEKAISIIKNIEKHNRRYYGGYIGIQNNSELLLYVNLRSMAYDGERCAIYVGGGYTSQSNALDEWKETEIKSKTLIDVIENHNLNIQ